MYLYPAGKRNMRQGTATLYEKTGRLVEAAGVIADVQDQYRDRAADAGAFFPCPVPRLEFI